MTAEELIGVLKMIDPKMKIIAETYPPVKYRNFWDFKRKELWTIDRHGFYEHEIKGVKKEEYFIIEVR